MKKTIQIQTIAFLGSVVLFIGACTKEGPAGPKGDPGQNGHTNVYAYNYSFTSGWPYTSPSYYRNLAVPALNAANIDSAAVMVYFSKGLGIWDAMPFTQYNGLSPNYFMNFDTGVGNVQVTWTYNGSSQGSDPNTYYNITTIKFKVVVIPPSGRVANPDLDLRDYKEVKKRFHLQD